MPGRRRRLRARLQPRRRGGERAVSARTRFLLPVHLYGQLADLRRWASSPRATALAVVEDACQAHGAERDGYRAGAARGSPLRSASIPAKNLGAMGDAGALVTDDDAVARRCARCASTGRRRNTITASWDTRRGSTRSRRSSRAQASAARRLERAAARRRPPLRRGLDGRRRPRPAAASPRAARRSWHLYVVRTAHAGRSRRVPRRAGRRHRPPLSRAGALSPGVRWLGPRRRRSRSPRRSPRECLSLPIFPGISEEQLEPSSSAIARLLRWLTRPANEAPYRLLDDVAFGEDVVVARSRTSTAARSATGRASARSSRSSAAPSSARAARSRATHSSATASRSATRSSSATASSSSTTSDRVDRTGGLSRRKRTGRSCRLGRARRLHRLGRRCPRRRPHRRRRARRRGAVVMHDVPPGETVVGNPGAGARAGGAAMSDRLCGRGASQLREDGSCHRRAESTAA